MLYIIAVEKKWTLFLLVITASTIVNVTDIGISSRPLELLVLLAEAVEKHVSP